MSQRQLALQKRKLHLVYLKWVQLKIPMFSLTDLIGVFVMFGWEAGIVLLLY